MFSYLQIAAIILTITLIKWDTNNCQIVTKYGGITLIGFITGLIMGICIPALSLAVQWN